MMGTTAVPADYLARTNGEAGPHTGQPLCPACRGGRLHPYLVEISLTDGAGGGWHGADWLSGWVAVCVGNEQYNRAWRDWYAAQGKPYDDSVADEPPCGFSMSMTPHQRQLR